MTLGGNTDVSSVSLQAEAEIIFLVMPRGKIEAGKLSHVERSPLCARFLPSEGGFCICQL